MTSRVQEICNLENRHEISDVRPSGRRRSPVDVEISALRKDSPDFVSAEDFLDDSYSSTIDHNLQALCNELVLGFLIRIQFDFHFSLRGQ